MNIPNEIIEAAQGLPSPSARGQYYAATLEYILDGREPDYPMCVAASQLFTLSKPVIDAYSAYMVAEV